MNGTLRDESISLHACNNYHTQTKGGKNTLAIRRDGIVLFIENANLMQCQCITASSE